MQFYIAYPNGAMGHTILAHSLYACCQANFEPAEIFSTTGDAHLVQGINRSLFCYHPEHGIRNRTILWITCDGWHEILRRMLSYNKSYRKFPEPGNFHEFGCVGFEKVEPLEWLSIFYHDYSYSQQFHSLSPVQTLGDYIDNRLHTLRTALEQNLGWIWDQDRSDIFHATMLAKNRQYLERIDLLRSLVEATKQQRVQSLALAFWEKATVISKCCADLGIDPRNLGWNEFDLGGDGNQNLISALKHVHAV